MACATFCALAVPILDSAQNSEVKEKPPTGSYEGNRGILRRGMGRDEKANAAGLKILGRASAEGVIVAKGIDVYSVHPSNGMT